MVLFVFFKERKDDCRIFIVHSTKLLNFFFVESSTSNPKLFSVRVPIKFPWKRRNFVECTSRTVRE